MNNDWSAGDASDRAIKGQAHGAETSGVASILKTELKVDPKSKIPITKLSERANDSPALKKKKNIVINSKKGDY